MAAILRVPRSRGALSGVLLMLLGVWGALIPFVGPYFHYAYTPDSAWTWTAGRLWMEIVPGAAVAVGGLILLASALRPSAMLGGGLAAAGGAWFVIGPLLHPLWPGVTALSTGAPASTTTLIAVAEQIGFFTGLGLVIVFLAAGALGRLAVVATRDAVLAEAAAGGRTAEAESEAEPAEQTGRHQRSLAS